MSISGRWGWVGRAGRRWGAAATGSTHLTNIDYVQVSVSPRERKGQACVISNVQTQAMLSECQEAVERVLALKGLSLSHPYTLRLQALRISFLVPFAGYLHCMQVP